MHIRSVTRRPKSLNVAMFLNSGIIICTSKSPTNNHEVDLQYALHVQVQLKRERSCDGRERSCDGREGEYVEDDLRNPGHYDSKCTMSLTWELTSGLGQWLTIFTSVPKVHYTCIHLVHLYEVSTRNYNPQHHTD